MCSERIFASKIDQKLRKTCVRGVEQGQKVPFREIFFQKYLVEKHEIEKKYREKRKKIVAGKKKCLLLPAEFECMLRFKFENKNVEMKSASVRFFT